MRRNELAGRYHAELIFPNQVIDGNEPKFIERYQNIFQIIPTGKDEH
jgi:hypothetical protein